VRPPVQNSVIRKLFSDIIGFKLLNAVVQRREHLLVLLLHFVIIYVKIILTNCKRKNKLEEQDILSCLKVF
jgi:hypothetical protein